MNIANSTCLITGASGGIGQAIVKALDAEGARLILVGRNQEKLTALLQKLNKRHQCLIADTSTDQGRALLIDTVKQNPCINLVIQAAGSAGFGEYCQQSPTSIEQTLTNNLTSPMLIAHGVLPALQGRPQATLVNVGSTFGAIGYPCFASYCASKFGLRGFTEALQREADSKAISIHYFAPRATRTPFNSDVVNAMNLALGNKVDPPEAVARAFIKTLKKNKSRWVVGWPEKLFCRLNGLWPELVDKALASKRQTILGFGQQDLSQSSQGGDTPPPQDTSLTDQDSPHSRDHTLEGLSS